MNIIKYFCILNWYMAHWSLFYSSLKYCRNTFFTFLPVFLYKKVNIKEKKNVFLLYCVLVQDPGTVLEVVEDMLHPQDSQEQTSGKNLCKLQWNLIQCFARNYGSNLFKCNSDAILNNLRLRDRYMPTSINLDAILKRLGLSCLHIAHIN